MTLLKQMIALASIVVTSTVFGGCNGEKPSTESNAAERQQHSQQKQSGQISVKIMPEPPTAANDLQAVFNEGGAVMLRWEKNGQRLEGETSPRLAKSKIARGDTITLMVISGKKRGKVVVSVANSPPEVRSIRFKPEYIFRGQDIAAVIDGFDADGDEINYSAKWSINGGEVPGDSLTLKGSEISKGDRVSVVITPKDNYDAGKPIKSQTITIPNACPWFISTPPVSFQGNTYSYTAVARDPDGDAVTYSLAAYPKGMTIDKRSGRIVWQVSAAPPGSYAIEIIAEDSEGAKGSQKFSINIK